jgi:hypothetical protein
LEPISRSRLKITNSWSNPSSPTPADTYTIAIGKSDGTGGHAVTPYRGNGQYRALMHDNNWRMHPVWELP